MSVSNPLDLLLIHDRWATKNLLDTCAKLEHDQFHQRFDMGLGNLHNTTSHILGAMRGWGDMLAGREIRGKLEETERTAIDLSLLLEEIAEDFAKSAYAHPLEEVITGERGGRSYSFTRGAVLTHVSTHGMHHRAQCLNMMRQLGVEPLPPVSVLEWMLMVDSAVS